MRAPILTAFLILAVLPPASAQRTATTAVTGAMSVSAPTARTTLAFRVDSLARIGQRWRYQGGKMEATTESLELGIAPNDSTLHDLLRLMDPQTRVDATVTVGDAAGTRTTYHDFGSTAYIRSIAFPVLDRNATGPCMFLIQLDSVVTKAPVEMNSVRTPPAIRCMRSAFSVDNLGGKKLNVLRMESVVIRADSVSTTQGPAARGMSINTLPVGLYVDGNTAKDLLPLLGKAAGPSGPDLVVRILAAQNAQPSYEWIGRNYAVTAIERVASPHGAWRVEIQPERWEIVLTKRTSQPTTTSATSPPAQPASPTSTNTSTTSSSTTNSSAGDEEARTVTGRFTLDVSGGATFSVAPESVCLVNAGVGMTLQLVGKTHGIGFTYMKPVSAFTVGEYKVSSDAREGTIGVALVAKNMEDPVNGLGMATEPTGTVSILRKTTSMLAGRYDLQMSGSFLRNGQVTTEPIRVRGSFQAKWDDC